MFFEKASWKARTAVSSWAAVDFLSKGFVESTDSRSDQSFD